MKVLIRKSSFAASIVALTACLVAVPVVAQTDGSVKTYTAAKSDAQSDSNVADWTQWRGPNRDCLVKGDWPESLQADALVEKWSVPLGPSYSGPIVVGDRVFTTETKDKSMEVVSAYDRNTGKQLWKHEWKGAMTVPFFARANGSWIRSTPAYDSGKLYVGGILDVLVCMDAETGKELWKIDFKEKYSSPKPTFGFVSSPLIEGEFLFIQAGSGFCKIKKDTGEVVWRTSVDGGGMMGSAFSSPIIGTIQGKKQAIVQTRMTLKGIDLENGSELWAKDIKTFRGMNILTPTIHNDGVFISAYGGTSQLLRMDKAGENFSVDQAWEVGQQGYMSSPVVVNNHAYLTMRNKTISCFDLDEGEMVWSSPRLSDYSSLVSNGKKVLALDSTGKLILFNANPEKFEKIDVRKVADNSWAHIAIRGDQLFVRDLKALKVYDWKAKTDAN